ncbi:MAG: GAF domain-containing sensor histidine kinase [Gemmatimonadaceae bacterium]
MRQPKARATLTERAGRATAAGEPTPVVRELMAVREIVHAFLTADRPEEVYQFALERVSPLVGAAFASIYLVDGASEIMRLAAAYNWPVQYRDWLGDMRVRVGFGPSGEAASERRAIEVPDVFADPALEDWQEIASELGFKSLVAIPLQSGTRVLGTATFYFSTTGSRSRETRGLLRIVADQLAGTAEKARLIDELRRANAALVDANEQLELHYIALLDARRIKEEFLSNISHELRTPLTSVLGYIALLQEELSGPLTDQQQGDLAHAKRAGERLLDLIEDLLELTSLRYGAVDVKDDVFDPRDALRVALETVGHAPSGVELRVRAPASPVPNMRSDRRKITKVLVSLLNNAFKFTPSGSVTASLHVGEGRAVYRVQDTGVGIPAAAQQRIFDDFGQLDATATRRYAGPGLGLTLARRLAQALGGDIVLESVEGEGSTFTVELPLEYVRQSERRLTPSET